MNGPIDETCLGYVDSFSPRSSYPLAKRAVEFFSHNYAKHYGVPVTIARLSQTTGAGVSEMDKRVINDFCRRAAKNENIILRTMGESAMPYCHVDDAVAAIEILLKKGIAGEAYNICNESTYISISDLARFVRNNFNPTIEIEYQVKLDAPYPPTFRLPLSSAKMASLGWIPKKDLCSICSELVSSFKKL